MIETYDKLLEKIKSLNYGTTVFKVEIKNGRHLELTTEQAPYKTDLLKSTDWLEGMLIRLSRTIDKETGQWVATERSIIDLNNKICDHLKSVIYNCVKAKAPERTTLYKDYVRLCADNGNNAQFLNDAIQVINYYVASTTDSTCKSNVIGLLTILRKRYDGRTSNVPF